jgi:hypothetical protein
MTAIPGETPTTIPLVELIIATLGLFEVHKPPISLDDKVVDPLEQIAVCPLSEPAFGAVVTVISLNAVASAHPPVPKTV